MAKIFCFQDCRLLSYQYGPKGIILTLSCKRSTAQNHSKNLPNFFLLKDIRYRWCCYVLDVLFFLYFFTSFYLILLLPLKTQLIISRLKIFQFGAGCVQLRIRLFFGISFKKPII